MKKYAFISNNVVQLVEEIEEEEYVNHVPHWQSIIDVSELVVEPKKGWILQGNVLMPVSSDIQQYEQQIFGAALALDLVNKMGSRNLMLAQTGSIVNVAALLSSIGSVKSLLETGALKTARQIIVMVAPAYPSYSDIFNDGITRITTFLTNKGWE